MFGLKNMPTLTSFFLIDVHLEYAMPDYVCSLSFVYVFVWF